jgi:two-component system, sensor histidine kinase and response regulator
MENGQQQILIVDDTPKNIQLLGSTLKDQGYAIAYAMSGQKAIEMLNGRSFDLILLDVMMPEMDGLETCRIIKKTGPMKDIPVIFLTARDDEETIVAAFEAGGIDFIKKPFNVKELLARVKTQLDLQFQKKALIEANQTKDKFFSIISHDLKQPFTGIYGLLELMYYKYDKHTDEKRRYLLKHVLDLTSNTHNLLDELLTWSRIERGNIPFKPQMLNIFNSVEKIALLFSEPFKQKNISFANQIAKEQEVFADEQMLNTIFRNLIGNAHKFSYPNGNIRVFSETTENEIQISICDNGKGISPENAPKIFRKDNAFTTPGTNNETGTGLGLVLCHEFIKHHGGQIGFHSAPDVSTVFTFSLPIKCAEFNHGGQKNED